MYFGDSSFAGIFVVLGVLCAIVGGLVVLVAPWLWGVIKPFIHAMTG